MYCSCLNVRLERPSFAAKRSMAAEGEKKPVLEMVQADGADDGCVTFVMHEEDHTLGNSLRYMIMKNPEVDFCGYTITHPSETKINFQAFRQGLTDLSEGCQHVLNTFQARVNEFKETQGQPTE
uniref:DNA-directed RNA polymerases I and III subunit RPAC2 n=1 Tax=Periophthalmus magnuspinnatus TaxID=409849 RepID=A0A3B4AGP3_9GOBI